MFTRTSKSRYCKLIYLLYAEIHDCIPCIYWGEIALCLVEYQKRNMVLVYVSMLKKKYSSSSVVGRSYFWVNYWEDATKPVCTWLLSKFHTYSFKDLVSYALSYSVAVLFYDSGVNASLVSIYIILVLPSNTKIVFFILLFLLFSSLHCVLYDL
mgnify:CR=1 FL=1